jgi:cardiolipin synthase
LHSLVVMLGLVIYATASHTRRQRRHPSAAIAWVISLILLPYVTLPLYLIFGSRKVVNNRRAANTQISARPLSNRDKSAAQSGQLAAAIGLPEVATFERLTIHQDGGQALQALRTMIGSANLTLDVCSFLLGRDQLGDEIALLLIRRAQAGVQIRLLIDGIGFYLGGHPNLKRLSAAGFARTHQPAQPPQDGHR